VLKALNLVVIGIISMTTPWNGGDIQGESLMRPALGVKRMPIAFCDLCGDSGARP
jgi:hypothetical protein